MSDPLTIVVASEKFKVVQVSSDNEITAMVSIPDPLRVIVKDTQAISVVVEPDSVIRVIPNEKKEIYKVFIASQGPPGLDGEQRRTEYVTVSPAQVISKQVTLQSAPPIPSRTTVTPVGGVPQLYNVDFTVLGNVLTWLGLGMETIIAENDVIIIDY